MRLRIGVYALSKNEAKHCQAWAESCSDADVRVVTDTGSTDDTVGILLASGVTVATGNVVPWRWDDAHNLSLHHLPSDLDVAVRLDLDERILPGWREAIERAWVDGVNSLAYRYVWSWKEDGREGCVFYCDRVHARSGYRWSAATHEGLISWAATKRQAIAEGMEIHHFRDAGKRHSTDLSLLRVAVAEAPTDARARWYLARELDYAAMPEAVTVFTEYLSMPGGTVTERAYARRCLARLTSDVGQLVAAAREAPDEPDAHEQLALQSYFAREWAETESHARRAIAATATGTHATDPASRDRAVDLLAVSLWELGQRPEALTHAREAVRRCPDDPRLAANVAAMERILGATHA